MDALGKYTAELVHAQLEMRKPRPVPDRISVEELVQIAETHQMQYLLLGALLRAEGLSEEWKGKLRGRVLGSMMRTGAQVMELRELEKRFEEEKIACQPMKGACMKFIYPSPEMREMSDIDILIRSECMEKAQDVLGQMGYRLYRSVKHHDIYRKEPHIVLEAHRAMYDKTVNYTQYEYFSNLSRALPRDGYSCIYDFSREDFYIYMMAHMAKHFYQMGCGIRNLVDIYVYRRKYEKEMDNGYLEEEFEKLGLTAFTSHMKQLAQIWLGDAEGSEFYDQLFSYMLESGVYGKDENGIWNKFCRESMNGREVDRARLKVWYWFPPLYYMAEYYPWLEKHSWLLPCAWIVRGIHGIFQHKGTLKRHMIHEIDAERIRIYQNIYAQMKLDFR